MAEFLELIESIRAEQADVERLFGDAGQGVRSRKRNAQYLGRLAEAATFMADVYNGRRPLHQLREALSTSDFPYLFGDILDRQMLANYQEAPYSWNRYCKRARVRDFRQVKRFALTGAEGALEAIPQLTPYPAATMGDAYYYYTVAKYGKIIPLSWEAMINDDLGAFQDLPVRLGKSARRTEEKLATQLFVDTSGPHASLYTVGTNQITGNPVLSVNALQTAMGYLLTQVDSDGEPIVVERMTLVVPPQLQVTAANILNAIQIWAKTDGGGTSAQELVVGNWVKNAGIVEAVTNFYIPLVASSSNGSTSWFLFSDPNAGRPALEMGFLIGHEQPEVFMKSPNAQRVGGGSVMPEDGDFDTDAITYKVRHVVGGGRMDSKMTVSSDGSGS
jgi:hypothetical protein